MLFGWSISMFLMHEPKSNINTTASLGYVKDHGDSSRQLLERNISLVSM